MKPVRPLFLLLLLVTALAGSAVAIAASHHHRRADAASVRFVSWRRRTTTTPTTTTTSTTTTSTSSTPVACLDWLHASGSQMQTTSGQPALLRGENIMEAEWRNNLTWENQAIPAFASGWNSRVVIHGFASDPVNDNNSSYLSLLDGYVQLTKASHQYLIFSWRSYPQNGPQPSQPDARAFAGDGTSTGAGAALAKLAARYAGDSHVMFKLQVEPHDVPWSTVRPTFEAMVDQIRGAVGISDPAGEPLIFVPGVEWGKDISGAITDPVNRANVVYASHPYTSSANFQQYFGSAYDAGLPVFIGEFAPTAYMSMSDISALFSYTRQRGIGWAAWGGEYDANPNLVDTAMNPTSPFGTTVQSEMRTTPALPGC